MDERKGIDEGKILATARADIKRADDHYRDHVEQDLIRRYEVYRSDAARYRRMWPELSKSNEMRTFDLWSTVEWMLPDVQKAFFGSDRIISISGVGSEDAERAERVMKLIQWQLTVKNQGYRVFKSWFGDALVTNLGVLKCYWKKETKTTQHREVLDQAQLTGVIRDPGNRVTASEPIPDVMSIIGLAPQRSAVTWEETRVTVNQPVIEAVRPSDIRFTPDGRTLSECSMVAHRKVTTLDQLRRDARRGLYDPQAVEAAAAASGAEDYELTELEKALDDGAEDALHREPGTEKARTKLVVYECYMKSDLDGDGLLEDAIVTVCNDRLLRATENPYGRAPLFEIVPFWDSYQVWGKLGLAEIIQETQDAHTALLRQMVIGLGISNQPAAVVDETAIHMEDLNDGAQFIRSKGPITSGTFQQIQLAGLSPTNFQFFEYLRAQLEQWTPITRYNQGTDASSLNKTATGINMIMGASQKREEEIIRNFAETGIRELFRFLIQINQLYLDQPQVVRLQGDALEFSPDDLGGDFDLSVDASSGVGARDSKVQVLTAYLQQMLGPAIQMGVAGPDQFVMAGQKLLKLMGIEDADKYLMAPQPQTLLQRTLGMGGVQNAGPGAGEAGGAIAPQPVG
ncbi:MAG: hypothetical protein LBF92_03705 [Synergistaceae bacterium]|jgi:hypothetical protein|nr:hypothetical protein [Synergistaceae bacterium]